MFEAVFSYADRVQLEHNQDYLKHSARPQNGWLIIMKKF